MTDPPSPSPRLWILNLDGEHELEAGARYQPTARLRAIVERSRAALWRGPGALVQPGDLVLADAATAPHLVRGAEPVACLAVGAEGARPVEVEREQLAGMAAEAWLATERARAVAAALGVRLGSGELVEVLASAPSQSAQTPAEPITGNPPPPTSAPHRVFMGRTAPAPVSLNLQKTSILHQINARDFTAELHTTLTLTLTPDASLTKQVAATLDQALALLARPAPRGWLARRRFGAAGRGRKKLHAGPPSEADHAWLTASLTTGPIVIEPLVDVEVEYTRSGAITAQGELLMSEPCFQATRDGAWTHTERRGTEVARADDALLAQAFEAAGRALHATGYTGPFGIDAFRYRDPWHPGRSHLNPLSEINARYTMDWGLALAGRR